MSSPSLTPGLQHAGASLKTNPVPRTKNVSPLITVTEGAGVAASQTSHWNVAAELGGRRGERASRALEARDGRARGYKDVLVPVLEARSPRLPLARSTYSNPGTWIPRSSRGMTGHNTAAVVPRSSRGMTGQKLNRRPSQPARGAPAPRNRGRLSLNESTSDGSSPSNPKFSYSSSNTLFTRANTVSVFCQ